MRDECRWFRWKFAAAGLLMLGMAPAYAAPCADRVDRHSPVVSNGFAANLSNTRNVASPISSANVAQLRLAYGHAAPGIREKRGAPAVTEQAVFFSAGRDLIAMNRASGCQYWSYTVPELLRPVAGLNAVRSSGILFIGDRPQRPALVVAGDAFGWIHALDAVDGRLLWSRFVGTDPDLHTITGSVQYHDGRLIVPVSTREVFTASKYPLRQCCSSHGMVLALHAWTGETLWTYHTAAEATYDAASGTLTPNGMGVWATPAVDPARGMIYIGTGQNLTHPTTANSDAIVALDLASGEPRWVFQAQAGDAWNTSCELPAPLNGDCAAPVGPDHDFGAAPILARLRSGGDAVIAGSKNGVVYSLDPDTGTLNWSRRIGHGGTLGGIHWGMAVDADRVYAGVSDVSFKKSNAAALDDLLVALQLKSPQVPSASPGVYALDLLSGALVWEQHPRHMYLGSAVDSIYSAALAVTNDVVFAGSLDGRLRAFRSRDGKELWSYDTRSSFTDVDGRSGNGGTIDSAGAIVAGRDVLVNSGYDTFGGTNRFQGGPGNALLVLRLP